MEIGKEVIQLQKDRGMKKWHGFFMPEHVKQIRGLSQEYYKVPRPNLSDEQIEDMERLLAEGLNNKILLEITAWKNGFFNTRVGTVIKIDVFNKEILIQDELESTIHINFFNITKVSIK